MPRPLGKTPGLKISPRLNNGKKQRKIGNQEIIAMIAKIGPYPTYIAKALGCSYWAIWNKRKNSKQIQQAFEAGTEALKDLAENQIIKTIKQGDGRLALDFMKTKGKDRGYSTRVETTGLDGAPIQHIIGSEYEIRGWLTPGAVIDFAALNLNDEQGRQISPAAHHYLWLRLMCSPEIDHLLLIAPPEAAKTTWSICFAACFIGFWPEKSVIIASVSDAVAEQRSLMIRNLTETETWSAMFPNAMKNPGMKYEQAEWSLGSAPRLHPTMRSYGLGASIVGSRADLIIADDILDFDSTRSPTQRKNNLIWFHNSLLSRLKPNGKIIMIGTEWNAADLYSTIRSGDNDWVICHCPQLSAAEDGFFADLTWPDNFKGKIIGT